MALRQDGTLVSWGDDMTGQRAFPKSATNFVAIAAGGYSSMALLSEGDVRSRMYHLVRKPNSFSLVTPTMARSRYSLEVSSTLTDFVPVRSGVRGNGALLELADPSATNAHSFYRINQEN
jgi:hypothetical protein